MSQKLLLPINAARLTASMKTQAYQNKFGFVHYGIDLISSIGERILYASGNGQVLAAGRDSVVGNVVAILYCDAYNRATQTAGNVVFRYFHLQSIAVKTGDTVNKDTCIGIYGNTGAMKMGLHLHMEADADQEHCLYSPTVNCSSFLKGRACGATDTTMSNPLEWLHCKQSAPDRQQYSTTEDIFIRPEDHVIEIIT